MSKGKKTIDIIKAMELSENDIMSFIRFGMDMTSKDKKKGRVGAVLAAGSILYSFGRRAYDAYRETSVPTDFVLIVSEAETRLYTFLMKLIFDQADKKSRRVVEAELLSRTNDSINSDEAYDPFNRSRSAGREIVLMSSNTINQRLTLNGVTCKVTKQQSEPSSIVFTNNDGKEYTLGTPTMEKGAVPTGSLILTFTCEVDRIKFVETLKNHFEEEEPYRASVFTQSAWGGFARLKEAPHRDPDSVILHDGQMERILEHIRKFVVSEQTYTDLGIPWHTGVLFYGPPGTGKSSLAKMLASVLDYDTYVISLTSVKDDTALTELMSSVEPRSIVLLEDIDVARAATQSTDDSGGVTKQGLLNVLDGVASSHGGVVIMTTNHVENIQTELVRPGRVDLREEIGYLTNSQMHRMCEYFLGTLPENLPFISEDDKITPAELVGVFRDHIENLQDAVPTVSAFIENRKLQFKELELDAQVQDNI